MTASALSHKLFRTSVEKGLAPRQFKFIISSESVDRDRDIIRLAAWDFKQYMHNPVVLASHDHQRLPVGKSVTIGVTGDKLKAVVEFPPKGIYDYADTVHDLVEAGFLKAASVGFRALDSEPNGLGGLTIKKATLLEWSICAIGSNPDAMVERSAPAVMRKWLQSKHQFTEDDMDTGLYLEITDNFHSKMAEDDPFQAMCQQMLAAYSEMDSAKFRELMATQLASLGPNAKIDDFVRGMCRDGVVAPKRWRDDDELFEFDDRDLARAIGQVVADETARQTRHALNTALGRLD